MSESVVLRVEKAEMVRVLHAEPTFAEVKPGGFICGDDYSITGWWRDGVVRAFHDLLHDRAVIARYVRANQIMVEKLANQPA